MKKLYVYADFDWLKDIELVGELGYESLRGSDSYSFKFTDNWIKKYNAINLSEDINNYPGIQYTQPNKDIYALAIAMTISVITDSCSRRRVGLFLLHTI